MKSVSAPSVKFDVDKIIFRDTAVLHIGDTKIPIKDLLIKLQLLDELLKKSNPEVFV